MWGATFKLAVRNLLLHKLRSGLTLLGTILGVASVIAMLSVGEGSKQQALERIRELGATNVIVRTTKPSLDVNGANRNSTQGSGTPYQIRAYGLTYNDLRMLETLPTAKFLVPSMSYRKDSHHGRNRVNQARIIATTPSLPLVKRLSVSRGRFLNEDDMTKLANVAVLSEGAARALFGFRDPLEQPLLIGDGAYRVVGVLQSQDSGLARAAASGSDDQNKDIYVPLSAARSRMGALERTGPEGSREFERVELSEITIAVANSADEEATERVRPTAAMVRTLLEKSRPQRADFQVVVPLELMAQAEHEKRIWNLVLGSIAGISLLVGGIGIMNIMLATVTERTREIGIRRAIGAKRRDIIRQFLLETTVLSTTGGVLGIFLGVAIPIAVTLAAGVQTSTSVSSIVVAFGISVATGIIFGVYPAYKAAAMSPIEALRQQ